MNYFVGPNGTDVMVPRDLCERLAAALESVADQETRNLRQELRSCWESDLSRPRSTAADAVVLELDPSAIPHNWGVRDALLAAGATLRPPKIVVPPCPPGMVALYNHGASIRQVGARFGHSYNQTRRMLLQAGVTLRPRGAVPTK